MSHRRRTALTAVSASIAAIALGACSSPESSSGTVSLVGAQPTTWDAALPESSPVMLGAGDAYGLMIEDQVLASLRRTGTERYAGAEDDRP